MAKVYLSNNEIDSICTKGCQTMIKSIKAVPAEAIHNNNESVSLRNIRMHESPRP